MSKCQLRVSPRGLITNFLSQFKKERAFSGTSKLSSIGFDVSYTFRSSLIHTAQLREQLKRNSCYCQSADRTIRDPRLQEKKRRLEFIQFENGFLRKTQWSIEWNCMWYIFKWCTRIHIFGKMSFLYNIYKAEEHIFQKRLNLSPRRKWIVTPLVGCPLLPLRTGEAKGALPKWRFSRPLSLLLFPQILIRTARATTSASW